MTTHDTNAQAIEGAEGTPEGSPEGTDWKAEARKWEDRAKANFAQVKALQDEAAAAKAAQAELEAARTRLAELEQDNAAKERALLVTQVAQAKGVPADLLTGNTAAELEAHADKILAFTGAQAPERGAVIPKAGYQPEHPKPDEATAFVRTLFAKDND